MAKREFKFVGHNVKRVDGVEKVTGAARFIGDITVPGMLYGKILRSTVPHAFPNWCHADSPSGSSGFNATGTNDS